MYRAATTLLNVSYYSQECQGVGHYLEPVQPTESGANRRILTKLTRETRRDVLRGV